MCTMQDSQKEMCQPLRVRVGYAIIGFATVYPQIGLSCLWNPENIPARPGTLRVRSRILQGIC
jgi:hypothetical protein